MILFTGEVNMEGICGTLNSIFPECTLNKIRTPKRHDFVHRGSEHGGNMRNSK